MKTQEKEQNQSTKKAAKVIMTLAAFAWALIIVFSLSGPDEGNIDKAYSIVINSVIDSMEDPLSLEVLVSDGKETGQDNEVTMHIVFKAKESGISKTFDVWANVNLESETFKTTSFSEVE